jgi:hypothetical protein
LRNWNFELLVGFGFALTSWSAPVTAGVPGCAQRQRGLLLSAKQEFQGPIQIFGRANQRREDLNYQCMWLAFIMKETKDENEILKETAAKTNRIMCGPWS